MKALIFLLDFIFPGCCASCGSPVSFLDHCLCHACGGGIVPARRGCARCTGFIVDGECTVCSDRMFYLKRNVSVADYSGIMERVIRGYKFGRRRRLHIPLAELAYAAYRESRLECDLVTSVPMGRARRWARGFNQSELVARRLSRRLGIPHKRILREGRTARSQKELRLRDRFLNIFNRYRTVRKASFRGRRVLVVDDIFTTGATVNECARVLVHDGALEVSSLTLARAGIKKLEIV